MKSQTDKIVAGAGSGPLLDRAPEPAVRSDCAIRSLSGRDRATMSEGSVVSAGPSLRSHCKDCSRVLKTRWSGVSCDCGADWECY